MMYPDFAYRKCTLCQQVFIRSHGHDCPSTKIERDTDQLMKEISEWLDSNEAGFFRYLAEK